LLAINGTMIVIGRDGYVSALTGAAAVKIAMIAAATSFFIESSQRGVFF
jgi:hypothetical protein